MAFHHHKQIADCDCSLTEKAVLHALATFADSKGRCWPSQETIAEAAGVSDRTVRRALKSLAAKNIIRTTHTQTSNVYTMTIPGGHCVQSGWTACPVQADTVSDEHINESVKEKTIESGVAIANAECHDIKQPQNLQGENIVTIEDNSILPAKSNKVSATAIEALWKEFLPKHFDSCKFVSSFTVKERGQASQFIKKVGGENALDCLRCVIGSWSYVLFNVKIKPIYPTIGFLLQHVDEAMSYWIAKKEKQEEKAKYVPPPPKPKPVPKVEPVKEVKCTEAATLEELEEILAKAEAKAGKGGAS